MRMEWILLLYGLLSIYIERAVTQSVMVDVPTSPVHAPATALITSDVTLQDSLTFITWSRDIGGTNETIYEYDNSTSTGAAKGSSSSRVSGSFSGTIFSLSIRLTTMADAGLYYCAASDVNNVTVTNVTDLVIYYTAPASSLKIDTEGVSSLTPVSIYRLAPYTFPISCTLPSSYPQSDYFLGLYSSATTTLTNLTDNATASVTTGAHGVTTVTVSLDVTESTLGSHDVICQQIYPFQGSSTGYREARLAINLYDATWDPCLSSPCQNNGICTNTTSTNTTNTMLGFECTCATGYQGTYCELVPAPPKSPCDSNPCLNGGTCREDVNQTSYTCGCTDCYNGTTCDQAMMDPCENVTCAQGFACAATCPSYICQCASIQSLCTTVCAVRDPPKPRISVLYGDRHTLHCGLPSIEPVYIKWYRNGELLQADNETLYIPSVNVNTRGTYKCVLYGSCSTSATTQLDVILDVQPNKTTTAKLSVKINTEEVLTCRSEGRPEPLLYWEFIPKPIAGQSQKSQTEAPDAGENSNTTATTTTTTTTEATVVTTVEPQVTRLTDMRQSPFDFILDAQKEHQSGIYICRANLLNLTDEDLIIKAYTITISKDDVNKPTCCEKKKGMAAWLLAVIVLIVVIIIVVVVVLIILLLHKGKRGEGPFVCCFANAVHPDVKDREKDTHNGHGPAKYAASYADEVEMDKKERKSAKNHHIRRNSNPDSRHLVSRDDDDTPKSQSDDDDERNSGKRGRSKTPSPHSQNPIGSRAGALPPLDVEAERKRQKKRKPKRNRERERDEEEEEDDRRYDRRDRGDRHDRDRDHRDDRYDRYDRDGSGDDESASESRTNFRYRDRDY